MRVLESSPAAIDAFERTLLRTAADVESVGLVDEVEAIRGLPPLTSTGRLLAAEMVLAAVEAKLAERRAA